MSEPECSGCGYLWIHCECASRFAELKADDFPQFKGKTLPMFEPGDHVILKGSGELGVVVCKWWDEFLQAWDHYVAFTEAFYPSKQPDRPYVLRYLESSLEHLS